MAAAARRPLAAPAPGPRERPGRGSGLALGPPLHGDLRARRSSCPGIPAPSPRGLAEFLGTDAGEHFFSGAWGWLPVIVLFAAFNTVLGEELLFRGLLLPRMRGVFGRYDWVANGVLFACYHLHTPWVIPTALINVFAISYPSRRYESAWMGILVHSTQSVGLIAIVLALMIG